MSKRKPKRPRLEVSQTSSVYAVFDDFGRVILCDVRKGHREEIALRRKDVTRLRKFLEKYEAYFAARKERR